MNTITFSLMTLSIVAAGGDLDCLRRESEGPDPREFVYRHLQGLAYAALDRREAAYEQLNTPDQIEAYQERLRGFFVRQLGGFPVRTPLNSRVVGTLAGDGYRVEKILFESQPNHHVTAVLYLPEGDGPYPGAVVASGHSRTAKTADYNQRYGIALAQNGIAALCYDPIGQGERSQILDAAGEPQFGSTTREHLLIGVGSILVGTSTARYRIWDGIRSIDYLCSRSDIDPQRIGFTGCSGGGTLTSYVMALDDRVVCAAPSCYLTTFRKIVEKIGPQDAEQNIFGQLDFGLDQPDYVLMRAPQPTLISATTDDYFDIAGAWANFRQAKRLYTRLGAPERVDLVEAPGGHGVKPANLVATVRWMRRWLLEQDDAVELREMKMHPIADLLCTADGQVLSLPKERSVFDLNVEWEQRLASQRAMFLQEASTEEVRQVVRDVLGVDPIASIEKPRMEKIGRVMRDGYHIDKLVLWTDAGLPIPILTYHPEEPQEEAYLYLHGLGKTADGAIGGPIERLVSEGYVVVAADLLGFGETARQNQDELMGDWKNYYLAYLLGESFVALRTEDVLRAGRWVAEYETEIARKVHLVAVGAAGVPALHAAALEPTMFATIELRDTIASWRDIVAESVPTGKLMSTIHGVLGKYDLPDLIQVAGIDKVTVVTP
jgi:dienelactone hydrolase